jgi:hypothetical protein
MTLEIPSHHRLEDQSSVRSIINQNTDRTECIDCLLYNGMRACSRSPMSPIATNSTAACLGYFICNALARGFVDDPLDRDCVQIQVRSQLKCYCP